MICAHCKACDDIDYCAHIDLFLCEECHLHACDNREKVIDVYLIDPILWEKLHEEYFKKMKEKDG